MANADKCNLNIPFKNWAASIDLDADGKVDRRTLDIAAQREFENNKAIERRINDPGCDTSCCAAIFSAGINSDSVADAGSVTVDANATNSGDISPTGFSTTLAAGAWMVTGYVILDPTGTATGYASTNYSPGVTSTQGGRAAGFVGVTGQTALFGCPFSGVVVVSSGWVPNITVSNNTGTTLTVIGGEFSAVRSCDPCSYDVAQGG